MFSATLHSISPLQGLENADHGMQRRTRSCAFDAALSGLITKGFLLSKTSISFLNKFLRETEGRLSNAIVHLTQDWMIFYSQIWTESSNKCWRVYSAIGNIHPSRPEGAESVSAGQRPAPEIIRISWALKGSNQRTLMAVLRYKDVILFKPAIGC